MTVTGSISDQVKETLRNDRKFNFTDRPTRTPVAALAEKAVLRFLKPFDVIFSYFGYFAYEI